MTYETQKVVAALLEGIPIVMLAVDRHARMIAANRHASVLLGADLLDRPFVTVMRHPSVVQAVDWVLAPEKYSPPVPDTALPPPPDGGVTLRVNLHINRRDIATEITVSPLPSSLGGGALIAIYDQTEVEESEQAQRDFVANVSHELRTPLTAVCGFIETLRGAAHDDEQVRDRFLDIMAREAGRMNRLVQDLLSVSGLQADERRRPSACIDLTSLLQTVLTTMQPAAETAGVVLESAGLENAVSLPGETDQLVQVFQNLIDNAIKYGGSGGRVKVSLIRIGHEPLLRGPGWAVSIQDFGEGIDEIHLPRLTERFYRVDAHRSRAQGGTGLGLAIVNLIVNRHRGRLRIESTKNVGSRFTVILPEAGSSI